MGEKTANVGHFAIPTAPAAGTSCTSGAANVFTTTYVQLIASTVAALFITGIHVEKAAASAATYCVIQLASGGAGSETIIGQYLVPLSTASTVAMGYRPIYPPIPVANAARISCKTADSVGAQASLITLECIAQANVVDDGVPVATVTTVTNQLTAAAIATGVWQDAVAGDFTIASSIGKALFTGNVVPGGAGGLQIAGANAATTYASLTVTAALSVNGVSAVSQTGDSFARLGAPAGVSVSADVAAVKVDTAAVKVKTDFLPSATAGAAGGVFIAGTNAATTITTGLTTTFTGNLTGSVASVSGAVGSVTGAVGSVTGNVGGNVVGSVASVTGAVGSVTGLTASNLDTTVSSRMATYTQPTGFLAATFPLTLASTTNITAGTIATVTNLTNAPTNGDLTATMKASVTTAATAATPIAASVSGAVGSVTGNVGGNVVGSVASVTADVGITQAAADKVWGTTARLLTAGTNIVLAKGVGLTGLNDIAATAIVSSGAITTSGGKVSGVILADTVTTYTGNTVQTGDAFARIGVAGAGLTALGDARIANLDATVSSRSTFAGGAVASVTATVSADVVKVNGTTITGGGTDGNHWGPA